MNSRRLLFIAALAAGVGVGSIATLNFIRARNTPASNACINNLRQLEGARQQWALEQKKQPEDPVTMQDLTPYLLHHLHCQEGGKYTIGPAVSDGVSCSFPGHTLPR